MMPTYGQGPILANSGRLSLYALVGDAAYPCRPWMLAPFKGHKDSLTGEEYHWNFMQSLTRMCIERAFGMLKGRWRILLKRVDVHLKNVPKLVSTYLVLHNICIIFCDSFWKNEWRPRTKCITGWPPANIRAHPHKRDQPLPTTLCAAWQALTTTPGRP